jgi:hypothetical protein
MMKGTAETTTTMTTSTSTVTTTTTSTTTTASAKSFRLVNGDLYLVGDTTMMKAEAMAFCHQYNATLAKFDTAERYEAIEQMYLGKTSDIHIETMICFVLAKLFSFYLRVAVV